MKKIFILTLTMLLMISVTACSNPGNSDANNNTPSSTPSQTEQSDNTDADETPAIIETDQSSSITSSDNELDNGIYIIGKDIAEGQYLITSIDNDYLRVVLFENEDKYNAYESSDRKTNGEETRAVELHGIFSEWIDEEEVVFASLQSGMVLLVDNRNGYANLQLIDDLADNIYPGIYTIGKDINSGQYLITNTGDWSLHLVGFRNVESYKAYHTSERFTNGEEVRAIELNAWFGDWISTDDSIYVRLVDGMILKVGDSIGQAVMIESPLSEIYPGIYIIGEDIAEGNYSIECMEDGPSITLAIFDDEDKYIQYLTSERFTYGEENAAIEEHSSLYEQVYRDIDLELKSGMILLTKYGVGQITAK